VCNIAIIPTLKQGENAVTVSSSFWMIGSVTWTSKEGDAGDRRPNLVELEERVVRRGNIAFCESTAKWNGKRVVKGMLMKMIALRPQSKI
jgi:hypothetical protein